MTNLTEKWEKGEIPDWFYWIEFQDGTTLPTTFSNQHGFICCDVICKEEKIKQILAAMPSYEEWQAKLEENTKLKELLKKCGDWLAYIDRDDGLIKQIDELLGDKTDE